MRRAGLSRDAGDRLAPVRPRPSSPRLSGTPSSAAAGVLCIAALAGCAGPAPQRPGLPEGVEVRLVQLRADVAPRQAQVEIVNGTDEPIDVGRVSVSDPRFAAAAVRVLDRASTVAPGATVHVRVQLPAVDCAAADAAAPTASIELNGDTVTAEIPDVLGFLPALHARECLAESLAEVADVQLAAFTPAGSTASVDVEVVPTGRGTATLVAVHPTPLLMYAPGAAAVHPIGVDIGADPTVVRLPLVPQRCDPHVVQEDKRGTIFTFDVVVDGADGSIDIPADPDMKARMLSWVAQACGFGTG